VRYFGFALHKLHEDARPYRTLVSKIKEHKRYVRAGHEKQ
jgi:hypothetical protein